MLLAVIDLAEAGDLKVNQIRYKRSLGFRHEKARFALMEHRAVDNGAKRAIRKGEQVLPPTEPVRDAAFRRVVLEAYDSGRSRDL